MSKPARAHLFLETTRACPATAAAHRRRQITFINLRMAGRTGRASDIAWPNAVPMSQGRAGYSEEQAEQKSSVWNSNEVVDRCVSQRVYHGDGSATECCRRQGIDLPPGAAKEFPRPSFILETVHRGFERLCFFEGHSRQRRQARRGNQLWHASGSGLCEELLPVGACFLTASQGVEGSRVIDVEQVRQSLTRSPEVLIHGLAVKIKGTNVVSFLCEYAPTAL